MQSKLIKFENGLTLAHCYMDSVRSVSTGIMVGAGCINETWENNGISHFIEHMVFKGTKKRTSFEIVEAVDGFGANINAFTSKQNTCFYTISIDEHCEECIDILSDIYFNATFKEEEMKREKGVILEEIAMCEDTPDDCCLELLASEYFKGHSLEKTILGLPENVKAFTKEDVLKYMNQYYVPNNTVISMVGNITEKDAIALVKKYFIKNFKKNENLNKVKVERQQTVSSQAIKVKDISQANVGFAFPSLEIGNKYEGALQILNTILGGGMSSKLFQSVREDLGLVYNIFTMPSTYVNDGYFLIFFASNTNSVKKAIKAIAKELKLLKEKGVSEKEFARAKEQIKGSMVLGQESTIALMRAFGNSALYRDELFDIDKKLDKIKNTTIEDIDYVINYIFDFDKVNASYVGPKFDLDILKTFKE